MLMAAVRLVSADCEVFC